MTTASAGAKLQTQEIEVQLNGSPSRHKMLRAFFNTHEVIVTAPRSCLSSVKATLQNPGQKPVEIPVGEDGFVHLFYTRGLENLLTEGSKLLLEFDSNGQRKKAEMVFSPAS